jgi:glycine betaine/choline ABC-type transport system substrate-binding protein
VFVFYTSAAVVAYGRSEAQSEEGRMMITRRTLAKSLAMTPVVALTLEAGVHGRLSDVAAAQEGPVRIGSKDFTEQLILGEM